MPEENVDEISRHGDDIVLHKLHMEQYLIDSHFIELSLGHDERGHGIAQQKKRAGRKEEANGVWTIILHSASLFRNRAWNDLGTKIA